MSGAPSLLSAQPTESPLVYDGVGALPGCFDGTRLARTSLSLQVRHDASLQTLFFFRLTSSTLAYRLARGPVGSLSVFRESFPDSLCGKRDMSLRVAWALRLWSIIGAVILVAGGLPACAPGVRGSGMLTGTPASQHLGVVATIQQGRRVLWVGAHPDDEVSSIGLLARAKQMGASLYLVSLTSGENSFDLWDGLRRGSEIGRSRATLFAQAASVLHADGFEVGPFTNGPWLREELDASPADAPHRDWPPGTTSDQVISKWQREGDPVAFLAGILRRVRPGVVVALDPHCGVTGHKEHVAVARLVAQAISLASNPADRPKSAKAWRLASAVPTVPAGRSPATSRARCSIPPSRATAWRRASSPRAAMTVSRCWAAG